ncbi:MAG: hypothetical protein QNJ64_08410 [Crocosphaera sp.]|nr:hypothetical protein [Crocosphaera sp.]
MRQTQKYVKATQILTTNHSSQEQLYQELNRLGWWWNAKLKEWERNEQLAEPPMEGLKMRLWGNNEEIEDYADLIIQLLRENGYSIVDKSQPYLCRPPQQNKSRIYLHIINNNR